MDKVSNPYRLAIIGGGWRTEFFLQIAKECPEHFIVTGLLVRNPERAARLRAKWGVPVFATLAELLMHDEKLDFAIVCVSWDSSPHYMMELVKRGVPVLGETPPAPTEEALRELYAFCKSHQGRVQIAEQYQFQPLHAARQTIVQSGKLGTVSQVQLSVAHGYHGVSLLRLLLGAGYEEVDITAQAFVSPLIVTQTPAGLPAEESVTSSHQVIAHLRFGDKLAVFDFTDDQYFSWIRSPRVLIRGERGEIHDQSVTYLTDYRTPVTCELRREAAGLAGNLEGFYLKGITCGEEWVYRNPFIPARLTDDELAGATCMDKMGAYARGGPTFYGLAEASQDHYLSLQIKKAVMTGEIVKTQRQPWSE